MCHSYVFHPSTLALALAVFWIIDTHPARDILPAYSILPAYHQILDLYLEMLLPARGLSMERKILSIIGICLFASLFVLLPARVNGQGTNGVISGTVTD